MPDFGPLPEVFSTPCAVVDKKRLENNIKRVAAISKAHGVAVRPHIKTHKSVDIAHWQLEAGAVGVTASRVPEAMVFIRGGVPSVTCAYPETDPQKLGALLDAAKEHCCEVRCMADSVAVVEALQAVANRKGLELPVFLKIDVGLHRCGLPEDSPELLALAQTVQDADNLYLQGILSHAGQAYAAAGKQECRDIAREEARVMRRVKAKLEAAGVCVPEVSVGSTPTVLAGDDFEGITEIRPGNYVFMDRTPIRLGLVGEDEVALTVLATVISRNDEWLIVDAGSKTLSSDGGAHGQSGSGGFGIAYPIGGGAGLTVGRLSEEHGWIVRADSELSVGDVVRILPNHSCVVANLARKLVIAE